MQRFSDTFLSLFALMISFPFLIIICAILKFTGEGEIFFLQERVGRHGKTFYVYKFATMLKNSPSLGAKYITLKDDPRVLPFGKFLRKSKLNEIPQLFNVLKGEMSLIGPRPLTQESLVNYSANEKELIFSNRPGLSGIGSIIFSDEENMLFSNDSENIYKTVIAPFKQDLEIWFKNNNNFFVYFSLILITLVIIIFPNKKFIWKLFKTLPKPPERLKKMMKL